MKAMSKRLLAATMPLALAATVAGVAPAAAQEAPKPNILLIVGDDVGYGDLGPYLGAENPKVPTLDLARITAHRPAR